MLLSSVSRLHEGHAAVEVGVEGEHQGAVRDGLDELGEGDLVLGQEDDGGDAGRRAVGGEGGRGVAGRGAGHRADGRALRDHLLHLGDEHRHPEVLERAGVAEAALLDPEIADPDHLAEPLGPEEVGAALVHRDDVLVVDLRAAPTPSCPRWPSRRATGRSCSGRRRAASRRRRSGAGAPPCRAAPRAGSRSGRSGRRPRSGGGCCPQPGAMHWNQAR